MGKLERLKQLKKACLQQMFPQDGESVPRLRFAGFTGDWEQCELNSIADFNPKSILPDEFEYVDLESVVGTEMISHRTETRANAPSRAQRLAQSGDVFFQTVRPYQQNNYYYDLPYGKFVFSTGYAQLRPSVDGYFLLSRLQEKKFVANVLDKSTGTSYPAINSSDLAKIIVGVARTTKEQSRIGSFFRTLDNTIAIYKRKLEMLKRFKAVCLQMLFPQEGETVPRIRFAGFNEPWEQRKLSDIKDVRDGTHDSPKYHQLGHPLVTSKNLTESGLDMTDVSLISDFDFETINKRSNVDTGDILLGMIGSIGNPVIVDRDDFAIKNVALIKVGGDVPNNFLIQLLKSPVFESYIRLENAGNTQKFLGLGKIRDYIFYAPIYEEMECIGAFFRTLDELIKLYS